MQRSLLRSSHLEHTEKSHNGRESTMDMPTGKWAEGAESTSWRTEVGDEWGMNDVRAVGVCTSLLATRIAEMR